MPDQDYKAAGSTYEGGADEHYITYDLEQPTRGGGSALYPQVRRIYINGEVTGTEIGHFERQSGGEAFGMRVMYEQRRRGYRRRGYKATRGDTGASYEVPPTTVGPSVRAFERIEDLPEDAQNIQFRDAPLPDRYASALQNVR